MGRTADRPGPTPARESGSASARDLAATFLPANQRDRSCRLNDGMRFRNTCSATLCRVPSPQQNPTPRRRERYCGREAGRGGGGFGVSGYKNGGAHERAGLFSLKFHGQCTRKAQGCRSAPTLASPSPYSPPTPNPPPPLFRAVSPCLSSCLPPRLPESAEGAYRMQK